MATYIKPEAIKDSSLPIEKIDNVALDLADKVNALDDSNKALFLNKIGLGKIGVISQKQNWAGDYSGYTMSDLVYGIIPQANMDLFLSAGAEFNDTDAAITKTAPWGDEVQHLPGYFYLNGLGDISYEEMQRIYMYGLVQWTENMPLTSLFAGEQIRTILPFPSLKSYLAVTGGSVTFVSPQWIANRSDIEVLWFSSRPKEYPTRITCTNKMTGTFWNKVRYVQGEWDIKSIPTYNSVFIEARGLIHFMVRGVVSNQNASVCKHLSNASILFMIQNEAATSAITITLHPDAYARAIADADILAALEQHTNISLASV